MAARQSRTGQQRSASSRAATARQVPKVHYESQLYIPPHLIPKGMTYAWVRESTLNEPDPNNMTNRMVRGWQPVQAQAHPELCPPPLPGYEDQAVTLIRRGGLILCSRPTKDYVAARRALEEENISLLRDVAWTGQEDPNLPRFSDGGEVQFERSTAFKD